MASTEAQKRATIKYAKGNLKRVPLDLKKSDYNVLAAAAEAAEETINGYIKRAIAERMERETGR